MTPDRALAILRSHGVEASPDAAATVASLARHALRVGREVAPPRPPQDRPPASRRPLHPSPSAPAGAAPSDR